MLAITVLTLAVYGCKEKVEPAPSYLINQEKMVSIMVDMHLIETAYNLKLFGADTAKSKYYGAFESVFVTHEITKAEFDSSLYYYSTRTDQMSTIYDKVLEKLYELESAEAAAHSD